MILLALWNHNLVTLHKILKISKKVGSFLKKSEKKQFSSNTRLVNEIINAIKKNNLNNINVIKKVENIVNQLKK